MFPSLDDIFLGRFSKETRQFSFLHRFFVFLFMHARFFSSVKEEGEEEEKGGEK